MSSQFTLPPRKHPRNRFIGDFPNEVHSLLRILVCHSYYLRFDEKQLKRGKPYPPLATLQTAALLRQAEHDVGLFDAMLADCIDDYETKLQAFQPEVVLFYEDNHNYLSKMCLGRMRQASCDMIATARSAGARVISAGSDPSDAPETYLSAGADVVLLGEGLAALIAIIDRLNSELRMPVTQLIAGLPDVVATDDDSIVMSRAVAPLPTPSLAARSAWDLIDVDAYRNFWQDGQGFFSLNMAASRGCSFRCNWCAKPIWGDRYLQRNARDVANEMLDLKQEFDIDH
jgi:anaerobic magnesium-protoporphyrin IX monomethyl ester cyclase